MVIPAFVFSDLACSMMGPVVTGEARLRAVRDKIKLPDAYTN
jgi:hypothetical protein